LPKDFRLIDVKQRCIVQPTKLERYCVLSYVWGSAGQFLLKESNFEQLTTSNGIDTITNLPQTILDAIELCVKVGCPYLWVDSLCIIQDSPSDKHSQIRAMDAIYSQSYLGIFAAAGDGANAGLSPFGRHGRQPAIESLLVNVKPSLRLAATLSPQIAAEGIARSTWASRAWT
ncbi:heterokaryon incompatibility, partial [Bimuria novae-zelandiae CBS 107.79]